MTYTMNFSSIKKQIKKNRFVYQVWEKYHDAKKSYFIYILKLKVNKNKIRIQKKNENGYNINVCFFIQFPEMWNSEKTVYDCMIKDDRYNVTIIAVPKRIGINSNEKIFQATNSAYTFCIDNGIKAINACENGRWFNISNLETDYIFLQRPYDEFMPNQYSMYKLSKLALLCYIPYGFEFVHGIHLNIEYNMNFLNNVYLIFSDNEETKAWCSSHSKYEEKIGIRKVLDIGYPRFDNLAHTCLDSEKKTVMWLPRWSIDEANDRSYFFDYFEKFFKYFSIHLELKLIIRPHPLMFENFIEKGKMTKFEVNALLKRVSETPNICFDKNCDYLETFIHIDVMIADFTSLLIEFFVTKKPIIYCGESRSFNSIGKEMLNGMYVVSNWDTLSNCLSKLIIGEDVLLENRSQIIKKILKHDYPVAKSILDLIYNDATGVD